MTEREKIIKDHWRRFRGEWNFDKNGSLCIPVEQPFPVALAGISPLPEAPQLDILTFHKEYGNLDGRPAARIVCEGVVVDRAFLQ